MVSVRYASWLDARLAEKTALLRRFFYLHFLEKEAPRPLVDNTSVSTHLDSTGGRKKNRVRRFGAGES